MPLFRKKPVVIDAFQLPRGEAPDMRPFDEWRKAVAFTDFASWPDGHISIRTLEGDIIAHPGDWIIKGAKGEFYPCKPDIFAKTYLPARGEPTDIGIRVEEDPPEQGDGIRFMVIVRVDRKSLAAAKPADARHYVRKQFAFAVEELMKVVNEEHKKLNPEAWDKTPS